MKKIDLDVDFIGFVEPLTVAEEKALSDYFKQRKSKTKYNSNNIRLVKSMA
jgi:hypothetical protein